MLDDGMETDMDLGTYERMLDQNLTGDNFATSGQIFSSVLSKERAGGYLGRDVHPYFIAAQFHPEPTSRPLKPQPMFVGLVKAALERHASQG